MHGKNETKIEMNTLVWTLIGYLCEIFERLVNKDVKKKIGRSLCRSSSNYCQTKTPNFKEGLRRDSYEKEYGKDGQRIKRLDWQKAA